MTDKPEEPKQLAVPDIYDAIWRMAAPARGDDLPAADARWRELSPYRPMWDELAFYIDAEHQDYEVRKSEQLTGGEHEKQH